MKQKILGVAMLVIMCSQLMIFGGNVFLHRWAAQIIFPGLTYNSSDHAEMNFMERLVELLVPLYQYTIQHTPTVAKVEDSLTYELLLEEQAKDEERVSEDLTVAATVSAVQPVENTDLSIEKLQDFQYLLSRFYTVDSTTTIQESQLNAKDLLGRNMKISQNSSGPKVLIFHTHSQEAFADSVQGDENTTIMGMGRRLTEQLNTLGIETIHHEGVYDLINGKLDRSKAYQQAEGGVKALLNQYPSIEVVIDLHRDGVPDGTRLVTEIEGKKVAKIMYFNGLCRTKSKGDLTSMPNPYIQDNLAFSLQMQLESERQFSGFTRRIYLKGYRYNMHLMPKSLLIEAGAQTNTVEEVKNAMDLLAKILSKVLL